jgi:hypothetical protein
MRQLVSRAVAPCAVLAVLVLAGCGGGGDGSKVASVNGESSARESTSKSGETDPRQALLAFAQCMREHGVDMPDPQVNGQGYALIEPGENVDPAKQQAADAACRHLMADAVQNGPGKLDPAEEAKSRDQQLAFTKCMREHGIDMPDPQFGDNGEMTISLGGADADDPKFQAADSTCRTQAGLPGFGPGGGAGPGSSK